MVIGRFDIPLHAAHVIPQLGRGGQKEEFVNDIIAKMVVPGKFTKEDCDILNQSERKSRYNLQIHLGWCYIIPAIPPTANKQSE